MEYTFSLSVSAPQGLAQEVAHALQVRTRLLAQQRYPKLWAWTDRLSSLPAVPRGPGSKRLVGILCLVLGILLLVPGLSPGQSPALALAGAVGIAVGIWDLRRARRVERPEEKDKAFVRAADQLLEHYRNTADGQWVAFDETQMTVSHADECIRIGYERMERVMETRNLFLVIYEEQILLLKKEDQITGSCGQLRQLLQARTQYTEADT